MQHGISAIFILDENGERVLAKYFDSEFKEDKKQRKFEKTLFQKRNKANG